MRNVFIFIRRYFNFIAFLILQGLSISILVNYNKTHNAIFDNYANELSGGINKKLNGIEYFFSLNKTNQKLAEENARLRNLLASNFEKLDSSITNYTDTLQQDTTGKVRKYYWMPAKVVGNTVTSQTNYLILERGSNQGVKKDMAVISPEGAIGIVVFVSENYSKVMSLLHRNSRVSAMLKKGSISGSVEWDGKNPSFLTLKNIPKSAVVAKGDTVLTSNYSANFPSKIMLGKVEELSSDKSSNFYTIKIKTAVNFYNIQYAYVVVNSMWEEKKKVEETILTF